MKLRTCIILLIIWFKGIILLAQEATIIDQLNNFPKTIPERGPEFMTIKNYEFSIDSINSILLIIENSTYRKGRKRTETQHFYEIKLDHLTANSFTLSCDDNFEKFALSIKTCNDSVLHYWFDRKELVSILRSNRVTVGNWEYSEELRRTVETIAEFANNQFTNEDCIIRTSRNNQPTFIYGSDRAIMTGKKELSGELLGKYYLFNSTTPSPNSKRKKSNKSIIKSVKKNISKYLDKNQIRDKLIFIYSDKEGNLQNIYSNSPEINDLNWIEIIDKQVARYRDKKPVKTKMILMY